MNCWYCGGELYWVNTFTFEDIGIDDGDGYCDLMCCSKCKSEFEGRRYLDG